MSKSERRKVLRGCFVWLAIQSPTMFSSLASARDFLTGTRARIWLAVGNGSACPEVWAALGDLPVRDALPLERRLVRVAFEILAGRRWYGRRYLQALSESTVDDVRESLDLVRRQFAR